MDDYVQHHYNLIKDFFLKDIFSRALKEDNPVTKITDRISIGTVDCPVEEGQGVVSMVKRELSEEQPCYAFLIKDVSFHTHSKLVFCLDDTLTLAKKIIDQLNEAFLFIKTHPKVLIHCKKGMSRSSFVYLFYELKEHYTHPNNSKSILFELIQLLKAKRSCCMIGDQFIFLLCYFQYMYLANSEDR